MHRWRFEFASTMLRFYYAPVFAAQIALARSAPRKNFAAVVIVSSSWPAWELLRGDRKLDVFRINQDAAGRLRSS
jgi:hypothetical protein